jgi:hypothetical protein
LKFSHLAFPRLPIQSEGAFLGQPTMSDENKLDPFKPQQPSIPGVSSGVEENVHAAPVSQLVSAPPIVWVALTALGALILGGGLFYWSRSSSPKATQPSIAAEAAPPVAADTPKPSENVPLAPGAVATTEELAKAWSSKRFLFRDPVSSRPEPAMVVRLPHGEYWGFSLREPFGNCELEYISDLQKLRTEYNFHADHPMVGDPCNHTVYDLLRYGGGAASDDLVRGVIVQGNGIRPPMAIEIRTQGDKVLAVREE